MGDALLFLTLILLICSSWIIIFIVNLNRLNQQRGYVGKGTKEEIQAMIHKVYVQALAFEQSKSFIKALQKNLKHQIDSFMTAFNLNHKLAIDCLDCMKDTVDVNDMTFYVGDEIVDSLLREKLRICYLKGIVLDVIADLDEIEINKEHLFFIFSNLIDLVIEDVEKMKNLENAQGVDNFLKPQFFKKSVGSKKQKNKVSIRASKRANFFVLQLAYNLGNAQFSSVVNSNEHIYSMLNLLLNCYNGVMIDQNKNYKHIKTIVIPLANIAKKNVK